MIGQIKNHFYPYLWKWKGRKTPGKTNDWSSMGHLWLSHRAFV